MNAGALTTSWWPVAKVERRYQIGLVRPKRRRTNLAGVIRIVDGDTAPWKGEAYFADRQGGVCSGIQKDSLRFRFCERYFLRYLKWREGRLKFELLQNLT